MSVSDVAHVYIDAFQIWERIIYYYKVFSLNGHWTLLKIYFYTRTALEKKYSDYSSLLISDSDQCSLFKISKNSKFSS